MTSLPPNVPLKLTWPTASISSDLGSLVFASDVLCDELEQRHQFTILATDSGMLRVKDFNRLRNTRCSQRGVLLFEFCDMTSVGFVLFFEFLDSHECDSGNYE